MAVTPFRHIDFVEHEPVTKEKLDQFQSNVQWIVDNTPITLHVNDLGQSSISNLIVVGGRANLALTYGKASASILFNGAFDSSTKPVVTISVISDTYKHIWATQRGLDSSVFADARGFVVSVAAQDTYTLNLHPTVYVDWMAIGQRSSTYERF